ncbi:hypothetical protein ZIOFF_053054 [Zingiber officinale]|uniref:Secreted protein n=1 Tax=Zingiber officinale TaxID=94328 RepID=A0A8J5KPM6_ZINOF|nr:hypothetical protein ZIOFF_053054 [Zingiber officinale]
MFAISCLSHFTSIVLSMLVAIALATTIQADAILCIVPVLSDVFEETRPKLFCLQPPLLVEYLMLLVLVLFRSRSLTIILLAHASVASPPTSYGRNTLRFLMALDDNMISALGIHALHQLGVPHGCLAPYGQH